MANENKPELSCNNTVCKLTLDKSILENTKRQIISLAGNSPVIFIENEVNNMIELTIVVASLTPSFKEGLEKLEKEINNVKKYSESSFDPVYKLNF